MAAPPFGVPVSQDEWDRMSPEQQQEKVKQHEQLTVQPAMGPFSPPAVLFDPTFAQRAANLKTFPSELETNKLVNTNRSLQPEFEARRARGVAANPYQSGVADQTRAAQMALLAQMGKQNAGPSIAAMQGDEARGRLLQQALSGAAMGGGRGAVLGTQGAGAGLAADVAKARAAENAKSLAGMGSAASSLRGQDLRSALQQLETQQKSQALGDDRARFYASQGAALEDMARNAQLEQFKLNQRVAGNLKQGANEAGAQAFNFWATLLSMLGLGGK